MKPTYSLAFLITSLISLSSFSQDYVRDCLFGDQKIKMSLNQTVYYKSHNGAYEERYRIKCVSQIPFYQDNYSLKYVKVGDQNKVIDCKPYGNSSIRRNFYVTCLDEK